MSSHLPISDARRPIDPRHAAELLESWGFIAHPDLPDAVGEAYLLAAIRDRPTLDHFDPERLEVWVTSGSHGRRLEIERGTPMPLDRSFSWGTVRILDRFGISNDYVTFGGHLAADVVDGVTVCVLTSPAPLLRRGGHSQAADPTSDDLAAFFGRMMIAVDYVAGFEGVVASASPVARYAAFVADFLDRTSRSPDLRSTRLETWTLLRSEGERLRQTHPDDWQAGVELLGTAGLAEGAPSPR